MAPLQEALDLYREHCRARHMLTAAYLRGEITPREVNAWDLKNPQPGPPEVVKPELVWFYRPQNLGDESYDPYSFIYHKVFRVGGCFWRRGSGRSVSNRSTRHGRLNYPESKKRVRAYLDEILHITLTWRTSAHAINREEGVAALATVPHKTLQSESGYLHCAIVQPSPGHFVVYGGYEGYPPSLAHLWAQSSPGDVSSILSSLVRDGFNREMLESILSGETPA